MACGYRLARGSMRHIGAVRLMRTDRHPRDGQVVGVIEGPAPTPSQAQCATCKRTFGGVGLFDRHRKGGRCSDPATIPQAHQDGRGIWRESMPVRPPHWRSERRTDVGGRSVGGEQS
jgi:hypothetical protein